MSGELKKRGLSTNKEFEAALQITKHLVEKGHLSLMFVPHGGTATEIDDAALPECVQKTALDTPRFREIFEREIAPLLFPAVIDMPDEAMVGDDTPFEDLSERDKKRMCKRRGQVSEIIDRERWYREYRTKSRALSNVISKVSFQIVKWVEAEADEPSCANATIRISAETPVRSPASLSDLLGLDTESISLSCTLLDVQYLIWHLKNIEKKLIEAQEDQNA